MKIGGPAREQTDDTAVDVNFDEEVEHAVNSLFEIALDVYDELDERRKDNYEQDKPVTDVLIASVLEDVENVQYLSPKTIEYIDTINLSRWETKIEEDMYGGFFQEDKFRDFVAYELIFDTTSFIVEDDTIKLRIPNYPILLSFEPITTVTRPDSSIESVHLFRYEEDAQQQGQPGEIPDGNILFETEFKMSKATPEPITDPIAAEDVYNMSRTTSVSKTNEDSEALILDVMEKGYFTMYEQYQLLSLVYGTKEAVTIHYPPEKAHILDKFCTAFDLHLVSIPQRQLAVVTVSEEIVDSLSDIPQSFPYAQSLTDEQERRLLEALGASEETQDFIIDHTHEGFEHLEAHQVVAELSSYGILEAEDLSIYTSLLVYPAPRGQAIHEAIESERENIRELLQTEQELGVMPFFTNLITYVTNE